jgi:hypothetical protein
MFLQQLQHKLSAISRFQFQNHHSEVLTGWEGVGEGVVKTEWQNANSLLYYEEGLFTGLRNKTMKCSNVYRWQFNNEKQTVSLEHLRFGINHPVYLFDFIFQSEFQLISACPHLCSKDLYSATMLMEEKSLSLEWLIQKPASISTIKYQYY